MFSSLTTEKRLLGTIISDYENNQRFLKDIREDYFSKEYTKDVFRELFVGVHDIETISNNTGVEVGELTNWAYDKDIDIIDMPNSVKLIADLAIKRKFRDVRNKMTKDASVEDLLALLTELQEYSTKSATVEQGTMEEAKKHAEWLDAQPRISFFVDVFDDITEGGIMKSTYWLLLADTGVGKTTVATQQVFHVLRQGLKVGYFTAEMSKGAMYKKFEKMYPAETLKGDNLYLFDSFESSKDIRRILLTKKIQDEKLDFIVVDHIQAIKEVHSGKEKWQQLARESITLASVAKELDIGVLCLSQISDPKEKNPQHHKPFGSAEVKHWAEVSISVVRTEEDNTALHLTKNRATGQIATVVCELSEDKFKILKPEYQEGNEILDIPF